MRSKDLLSPFWELLPLEGLGPIRFLMRKSEVQDYKEIGLITYENKESLEQKKKNLEDTFNQFSEFFTAEDLKNAMDALQIVGEELDDVCTESRDSGISLEYKADQLTEILADNRAQQLHFRGIPIFSTDPIQLLTQMSKLFKEDPIIKGEELIFPNHKLFLFSFLEEQGKGKYREGNKRNRTIIWRNTHRPYSVELSEYRQIKLINE
ncbi:hypothetical protein GCM10023231_20260 [Olivibacter ginsenosidimutans]|uniref:Uncharacterized protein n=1 Tax=Olivibacter ginsenosidimutans TaxID=1176537 RepID=A0ABP9BAH8_9SPHI